MIGAGNQPPQPGTDPNLEEAITLSIAAEMNKQLKKDIDSYMTQVAAGNFTMDTNGMQILGVDEYGSIAKASTDTLLKYADQNLLQVVETVDKDQAAMIGEDNFKKRSKDVLTKKMQEELIKKTKFTMLTDPREHTIVTRARVYVFSEADLKVFIEKIMTYR